MLVHRSGRGQQQTRRMTRWPRWVQAWREDHQRRAAAHAEARAHAPIPPGERLLAVARGAGGGLLAATDWALYHQAGQAWARLGWDQVGKVDWDEQRHVLVLTGLAPPVPGRTVLRLARDWGLPAVAAERASWATVIDQRSALNEQAGARVVARRLPGATPIRWVVILDRGLDPKDLEVRTELESALAELRAVTGVDDGVGSELGIAHPW